MKEPISSFFRTVLRLHAAIVRLMPTAFRERFEDEIKQTARERLGESASLGGRLATWHRGFRLLLDAILGVGLEHKRELNMRHPEMATLLITLLVTVIVGAFIGWLDLTNSEVQVAVAAILLAGFALGLASPRRAWLWAELLGLSIPIAQAVALIVKFDPPYRHDWHTVLEAFMAFIPAFLGTYAGVAARWGAGCVWGKFTPHA